MEGYFPMHCQDYIIKYMINIYLDKTLVICIDMCLEIYYLIILLMIYFLHIMQAYILTIHCIKHYKQPLLIWKYLRIYLVYIHLSWSLQDYMMQQTMLRVKDPERSLKFYTGILGMTWVLNLCKQMWCQTANCVRRTFVDMWKQIMAYEVTKISLSTLKIPHI